MRLTYYVLRFTFYVLLAGLATVLSQPATTADALIPPTWVIVAEDFQGPMDDWRTVSVNNMSLDDGSGRHGSIGLSVAVDEHKSYLYQAGVARAEQGYLTFWFNPNGVSTPDRGTRWIPDSSIRIAGVKGTKGWHTLVALRVRRPEGQRCKAYLEWRAEDGIRYDYASGEFSLSDGWQKITLGFRVDDWVAVWLNDVQVRRVTGVTHQEAYGEIVEIGKTNANSSVTLAGILRYDDVAFQVPRVEDLWVDAAYGDDGNDGLTRATALRSIQKAANRAGPGTTVHILPGVYRETVWPAMSGSVAEPVLYIAEDGPGTAVLRGSEPASSLNWTQLSTNTIGLPSGVDPTSVYYADLSAWELNRTPRFVVELDDGGRTVRRLPLAREPDWHVDAEWKHHEFWWAADGGWEVASCDPAVDTNSNCDLEWRSTTQLTDRTDDADPAGVEPGNLTTLDDLAGATLVAMDTLQGHYIYRRRIVDHDVDAGRVTVRRACEHDPGSGKPGLGWGSKYYVEGRPGLLDTPGEWWYDAKSGRLYLWPPADGDPSAMDIEISRRNRGFSLKNRSYMILDGLTIELLNESAIYQGNYHTEKSHNNTVRNVILRYANRGLWLSQSVQAGAPAGNVTDGFTLEDSEIAHMDTHAIRLTDWWENAAAPDSFTRSGVLNTVIRGNELHHLGFRTDSDNAIGAVFQFAHRLRFEGNYIHHVAHNGVQFFRSVVQSPEEYGFAADEIKSGEILIVDNVFEKTCQLATDCAGLKIWGQPPDTHVFRDVLITGNVFRDTFGWAYVSEKRRRWSGGMGSDVRGTGGFGLYVDQASGIHVYRNIAYNNAYAGFMFSGAWRDGDIVCYNNVAADSFYGFFLGGPSFDTHGSVNTQVVNNIMLNNEGYGILHSDADGVWHHTTIDHNLYQYNGWRPYKYGGLWKAGAMAVYLRSDPNRYYPTLGDIQTQTAWELGGVEGNPYFRSYDPADHDLHDGSRPDFHLTPDSAILFDRGTVALPASLTALLEVFGVDDPHWGTAYDVGRYEGGFAVRSWPPAQVMDPGGVAHYVLHLYPPGLPHTIALTATSPSPDLTVALHPTSIVTGAVVTLTVTDLRTVSTTVPGVWYTVPITATGGGFVQTTRADLLVGGTRVYLPLALWKADR